MNFDQMREERDDLDFTICGEHFVIQRLSMHIVGKWEQREEPVDVSEADAFMQMLVDRVADAVADGNGSEQRWRELCAGQNGPSYGELVDIANMVWRSQTALPTQRLSSAPAGPIATGTGSKAE